MKYYNITKAVSVILTMGCVIASAYAVYADHVDIGIYLILVAHFTQPIEYIQIEDRK